MRALATAFTTLLLVGLFVAGTARAGNTPITPMPGVELPSLVIPVATCKSYRSCNAAVRAWCAGQHNRADGDGDGIPCENVCKSRRQVVAIMKSIGCSR